MKSSDYPESQSGKFSLTESGRIRIARRANLAEDLRSPVRAILLYARRMRDRAKKVGNEELLADLQKIVAAGKSFRDQLEVQFERAAAADDTIDVMLQGLPAEVRHDLRTPLNHIIGFSEMLGEEATEEGDKDLSDGLGKVSGWGRRLLKLFNRLTTDREEGEAESSQDPVQNTEEMIQRLVQTIKAVPDDDRVDRKEGRILVADDNDINRDLLCQQLERQGHQVSQACDGRQAIDMTKSGEFDVLLLDVMMPELNGIEVLQMIRQDEQLKHVPVIMLSALDELNSVARCIEIGAEDYIPKPYEWALLKARIESALEKKRLRDREVEYLEQIEKERKFSDHLLRVILPDEIVAELKSTDNVRPRRHDDVAVLFTDIVGFTSYCDRHEPEEVVGQLQDLVEAFEVLAQKRGIRKVKTIGDAFMATAGLLLPAENAVLSCLQLGLDMLESTRMIAGHWQLRTGIHVGPVVAGLLGKQQFLFDIWGDTVNTAARVVTNATPGTIALSREAWELVEDLASGERKTVEMKGKGVTEIVLFHEFNAPAA